MPLRVIALSPNLSSRLANLVIGKPGPHRVVFDEDCNFAGLITHIGASGGGFVECIATEGDNF